MNVDYKKLPSFSLILHGWNERFPFETLLPLIERYFAKVGVEPQIGSVEGQFPPQVKSYSMRTIRKRIGSQMIRGLHCLDAYHLTDKENKQSHDFAIGFDDAYGDQGTYIVNAVSPASEARAIALEFLRETLAFISPNYGYSVELPLGHDPILFARGMFARTNHAHEETTAWQRASHAALGKSLHKFGKLRHVFAINVLSPSHMANKIDGKSFADWVAERGHGMLEQWKDDVWVWFVPREDRIRVANFLQFNGLLTVPTGFENELIG